MIKELRKFYGYPQEVFANHFFIGRSQWSMSEIAKRMIPWEKLERIQHFYYAMPKDDELSELSLSANKVPGDELLKAATHKLQTFEWKLKLLQRKMAKLKKEHLRAKKVLLAIPKLRETAYPIDQEFINSIERRAISDEKLNGEMAQLKLEIDIRSVQASIQYLQEIISPTTQISTTASLTSESPASPDQQE